MTGCGGVLFVRLWKDGQPDSEVAIAREGADGSWEVPSWGGGPWVDDPMMRPADGWDGDRVVWLHHSGQFTQGDKDGVRAQAGAAAQGIAAIRVEQAGSHVVGARRLAMRSFHRRDGLRCGPHGCAPSTRREQRPGCAWSWRTSAT